ncbi:MAG: hypothetical protein WCJ30_10655, partial [Deltaproteobacteria bacterium]
MVIDYANSSVALPSQKDALGSIIGCGVFLTRLPEPELRALVTTSATPENIKMFAAFLDAAREGVPLTPTTVLPDSEARLTQRGEVVFITRDTKRYAVNAVLMIAL